MPKSPENLELQKEYQLLFQRCLEAMASGQHLPNAEHHEPDELIGIPAMVLAAVAAPILEAVDLTSSTMELSSAFFPGKKFKISIEILPDDSEKNNQDMP